MGEIRPWIGVCHLTKGYGAAQRRYQTVAAVFCADRETYDRLIHRKLDPTGYRLLWSEDVHPVDQWKADPADSRIAAAVGAENNIQFGSLHSDVAELDEKDKPTIIVSDITGIEPLDMQLAAHPRLCVPHILHGILFGQPDPSLAEIERYGNSASVPPLKTYGVFDANRAPYLLTGLLESAEVAYQCLFQGKAEEELKEYAPYLVELQDKNELTQHLFTGRDGVNGLWEKDLGIYIRSRRDFSDMRQHLRKFTRVQDDSGKWHYYTPWDGAALSKYPEHDALQPILLSMLREIGTKIICGNQQRNELKVISINPEVDPPGRKPVILTQDIKQALTVITHQHIQEMMAAGFPASPSEAPQYEIMLNKIQKIWSWLSDQGMTETGALKQSTECLVKFSYNEVIVRKDVLEILSHNAIGDTAKARLILRVMTR